MAPYAQIWYDVLSEINFLRNDQPTALRTRDIYNAAISHQVAAGTGEACTKAGWQLTSIVREATRRAGAKFVPVYQAFNGPDGLQDPKERELFQDLEHLSDRGAALMPRLHHQAGYDEITAD